jgi:hypothetical protein
MRTNIWICLFLTCVSCTAQNHKAEKIWETYTPLKTPESVLYYPKEKILFVSNIDGKPDEKDGRGSIWKLSTDGRILKADWITGLNAPKGMAVFRDKLYIADLTEIVVVDIKKEKITERIPVIGAVFLNDLTVDENGVLYVSDTRTFKVHKIENGKVITWLDQLKGPNGVLAVQDILYVLDRGSLLKVDAQKNIKKMTDGMDKSTDGLVMANSKEFIISCWNGIVYYLTSDGDKEVLFDKRDQKINSADIEYIAGKKTLYVPTFYNNKVTAYKIKPIIRVH